MPTYDYVCDDCGHTFEIFQSMTEAKLRTCSECGGALRRLIGVGAGVVFKGSGFYETDYRSSEYKKKQKSESGGEKGTVPDKSDKSDKPDKSDKSDKKAGEAKSTAKKDASEG